MSTIEWTDATWNPIVGCTPVSPGCLNCYAATMAIRMQAMPQTPEYHPRDGVRIAEVRGGRAVFTGDVRPVPDRLGIPLRWRKPRRVFVNSMSDLFHESVPDEFIRLVFAVMSYCGQHTFQVLTKRPRRMAAWFADENNSLSSCQAEYVVRFACHDPAVTPTGRSRVRDTRCINGTRKGLGDGNYWPLPNVWLGTSVENQAAADERIPDLLRCPAAVRFLSCEPLLGPIDLGPVFACGGKTGPCRRHRPDWVIVGGESGPNARPCSTGWIRSIVASCDAAAVPVFVKQLGSRCAPLIHGAPRRDVEMVKWKLKNRKGGDPAEWAEDLRRREWPEHL